MPITILLMAWILHLTIGLYQNVEAAGADLSAVTQICSADRFREMEAVKRLKESVRTK